MSLSLLNDYGSSSEEDEEAGGQNKTAADKFLDNLPVRSTALRLPMPSLPEFHIPRCITREAPTQADNTGKVRNFAHEPGNWATFVALPIKPSLLEDMVSSLEEAFCSLSMQPVDDFHISLTRVLVLRHHWINDFVTSIRKVISETSSFAVIVKGVTVYTNDEKTRTFLALNISHGSDAINDLVNRLDSIVSEYNLPRFYDSRSYHISVLWVAGDLSEKVQSLANKLFLSFTSSIQLRSCFCKTGNKLFSFYFPN